ncbi:MAG: hypothetical protein QOG53_1878 [Frankiales bacterium]|jgi:lipopolysaccharide/colanic/teichoic acid biosynthesis glycosyltransferase|nr:hypothetical protein [Frankiales bacterium]
MRDHGKAYDPVKRLIDILVSVIGMTMTAPLQAALAVLVRMRLGSPVLFRHVRPGRDGTPFTLLKFRTMRDAGPGEEGPDHDAARLSKLGGLMRATSLDELPTLWNVLRGDMSLVGPRPLLMSYVDRYTPEQAERLRVRPGITGWAQVNGRNAISWEQKFDYDRWYVHHRSLWLDLRILGRTALKVLRREGIAAEGSATMPEFMGSADEERNAK